MSGIIDLVFGASARPSTAVGPSSAKSAWHKVLGAVAISAVAAGVMLAGPSDGYATRTSVQVTIDSLRSDDGRVYIALYDRAEAFPKKNVYRDKVAVNVRDGHATVEFLDLGPGEYAMAFYHDENSNGQFDQGLFGIPLEGYGFTNDARPGLGPPPFKAAAFELRDGDRVNLTASMQY